MLLIHISKTSANELIQCCGKEVLDVIGKSDIC